MMIYVSDMVRMFERVGMSGLVTVQAFLFLESSFLPDFLGVATVPSPVSSVPASHLG